MIHKIHILFIFALFGAIFANPNDPACFGNATTDTVCIGGSLGIVNATGPVYDNLSRVCTLANGVCSVYNTSANETDPIFTAENSSIWTAIGNRLLTSVFNSENSSVWGAIGNRLLTSVFNSENSSIWAGINAYRNAAAGWTLDGENTSTNYIVRANSSIYENGSRVCTAANGLCPGNTTAQMRAAVNNSGYYNLSVADSARLNGQLPAFYLNGSNINAGSIQDAYISSASTWNAKAGTGSTAVCPYGIANATSTTSVLAGTCAAQQGTVTSVACGTGLTGGTITTTGTCAVNASYNPNGYISSVPYQNSAAGWSNYTNFTATGSGYLVNTTGAIPACGAEQRGAHWYLQGAVNVTDIEYVCMKNSTNAYNWVQGWRGD